MAYVSRRGGRVQVRLDERERTALLGIVTRLETELAEASAAAKPAYQDAAMQAEYDRWVRPDIEQGIAADIAVVRGSLDSGDELLLLTEPQVHSWLRCFNQLRLAAGVMLGISSDGWEEEAGDELKARPEFGMMMVLGWLQEELIAALES